MTSFQVAHLHMSQNSRLKEIFLSLLFQDDSAELFTNAEVIYKDLTRKLQH